MAIQIIKYELLYNNKYKKEFIERYESNDSKITIYWQLLKVSDFERTLQKDMSEMNKNELMEMIRGANCSTVTSAINHINTYKRYIDFMGNTTNPLYARSVAEFAEEVVDIRGEVRYTRDELMELIEERLENVTDKALLLAAFEGIKGKGFSELFNLSVDDLKHTESNYYALLRCDENGERKIEISETLYNLLILANEQKTYSYISKNGETTEVEFVESEFIFKKPSKGKAEVELDRRFISRKFIMFKEIFANEYLKFNDIIRSGMLDMAHRLYQEKGKLDRDDLISIGNQYNTTMTTGSKGERYRSLTEIKKHVLNKHLKNLYKDMAKVVSV